MRRQSQRVGRVTVLGDVSRTLTPVLNAPSSEGALTNDQSHRRASSRAPTFPSLGVRIRLDHPCRRGHPDGAGRKPGFSRQRGVQPMQRHGGRWRPDRGLLRRHHQQPDQRSHDDGLDRERRSLTGSRDVGHPVQRLRKWWQGDLELPYQHHEQRRDRQPGSGRIRHDQPVPGKPTHRRLGQRPGQHVQSVRSEHLRRHDHAVQWHWQRWGPRPSFAILALHGVGNGECIVARHGESVQRIGKRR